MAVQFEIDVSRLAARIDRLTPDVRAALKAALGPLAQDVAASARGLAADHIHFQGKKPGEYLASIYGGVSDQGERIIGYVRSGNPLAHLLEGGATIPAHEILPSVADVLAFTGNAGQVFAKVVNSPGATVPPYPAIQPAFEGAKSRIEETLTEAVERAIKS